jgi:hypothetical protein
MLVKNYRSLLDPKSRDGCGYLSVQLEHPRSEVVGVEEALGARAGANPAKAVTIAATLISLPLLRPDSQQQQLLAGAHRHARLREHLPARTRTHGGVEYIARARGRKGLGRRSVRQTSLWVVATYMMSHMSMVCVHLLYGCRVRTASGLWSAAGAAA